MRIVSQRDTDVREAASLEEARALFAQQAFDIVLIDVRLDEDPANRDGLTLLREVRERPGVIPIVVTGAHEMDEVRAAMRLGAYAYILKDELSEELVLPMLDSVRAQQQLEQEVVELRARRGPTACMDIVGVSPSIQRMRERIARVALSDRPVLVTGPTGAGKELVVRAIHRQGPHPEAPLLDLNCGAFPPALIESQLFGHERGAFTGADRRHDGFFTAVTNGTLFLDEIGELPLDLQAKLLRVLESGTYRPVGSGAAKRFLGRVVAATHANLEARVQMGQFREDLFYRLNVLDVQVPSLEERRDDIPALAAHFAATQKRTLRFTADALEALANARWPGNVRQLRNLVDRLAVFAPEGPITPEVIASLSGARGREDGSDLARLVRELLARPEADKLELATNALIDEAIRIADGNKTAAARLLGVHRKVVERRLGRPTGNNACADA